MDFKELDKLNKLLRELPESRIQIISPGSDLEDVNFSVEDNSKLNNITILPIQSAVLFPGVIIPFTLKSKKYVQLTKKIYNSGDLIGVVAQKNNVADVDITKDKDSNFFKVGTLAKVLKSIVFPDGGTAVILQGRSKFRIKEIVKTSPHIVASIEIIDESDNNLSKEANDALLHSIKDTTKKLLSYTSEVPSEVKNMLNNVRSLNFLTYFLASNLEIELSKKQEILESSDLTERAGILLDCLMKAFDFAKLKRDIQTRVHTDITQNQKEQYLRYHIKALQEELGEDELDDIEDLQRRAKNKKWPESVKTIFNKTINKAKRMSTHSPDYATNVDYAELLLDMPWKKYTKDNLDIKNAEEILNKEHYGLEKVKERILEHLAVCSLKENLQGPIMCLHGPPGVGKTSLGKSIAKALGRGFARFSLGGVTDEGEIRGHRRTYIGAMPGKIISTIKKLKTSNPIILLDEIDKIGVGMKGDPYAALLEVLDSEQNDTFLDNYLDIPYDLSKVMFIATANSLSIPSALRDRMEIIEMTGYTVEEKIEIAKRHLIPKQRKAHGLKAVDLSIDTSALVKIIENYTSESGVRELERKIAAIHRKVAKYKATQESYDRKIKDSDLYKFLGLETIDKDEYHKLTMPGVAVGLAWTSVGGEILFIETSLCKGKGLLTLSGQLGDVMKESASTALSYLKSHASSLNIDPEVFATNDLHIHFPAGAVPKDGPSAGITVFTALASLYTNRKVRDKLAMTGEATLRGKVLPVGGIKEKILAAKRVGITEIILSKSNEKDIKEIPRHYLSNLIFTYVDDMDSVLLHALEKS
jgi:ATP-dependent Lon protease